MSLTNLGLTADMNRRLGPLSALADLPSAFAWAAREVSPPFAVAGPFSVTDDELLAVPTASVNQYLDLVEYRATDTIFRNLSEDNLRQVGSQENIKDIYASWERRVKRLRDELNAKYGYSERALQAGVYDLGFAETGCDREFWY